MIDLDAKFYQFLEKIELSDSQITLLRNARDAIRNKIRNSFDDIKSPKFRMQGSFAMGTTVQVLTDIEYDLDDGLYLQHFEGKEKHDWDSVHEVHDLIFEGVKDHTYVVENKAPCVRVTYSKNYHIDLPIYIVEDDIAYLAHLDKGWIVSDPKALKDWFQVKINENSENLRDLVKIIKAWKDNINYDSNRIDLCGLAITILVSENYLHNNSISDALLLTITELINVLETDFTCYKPVMPTDEDLFFDHSNEEKVAILDSFREFQKALRDARDSDNEKIACERLKSIFGSRFPSGSESITNQKFVKTKSPAVLNKDGKSA